MPKYKVDWTEEQWFRTTIEADSKEDALNKFWEIEYSQGEMYGAEIQDSVEFELIEED
jgi:hypothetical protein|tara:strand:+ start:1247 stop:1420 length:174 start_codon:yes stop_codon:yes gene_type:complete